MNSTILTNNFILGIINNIKNDFEGQTINEETIQKMIEKYTISNEESKKKRKITKPRKKTAFDYYKIQYKDKAVEIAQSNKTKWLTEISIMWKALSEQEKSAFNEPPITPSEL